LQQYWGDTNTAYQFMSVAEMADRFKASKFGQAIAADLAAPVQESEVGDKHHGKEMVRS
jgi:hypothetical protein